MAIKNHVNKFKYHVNKFKYHVNKFEDGVEAWNNWRKENPQICPNLSGEFLGLNLDGVNLSNAILHEVSLEGADLIDADLSGADLRGVVLDDANLSGAKLIGADLSFAWLSFANLRGANLSRAKLIGADLMGASLVDVNFTDADLTGSRIYGISAWGLKLSKDTKQRNLVITKEDEPEITVDNLEVAQFIYLLLHNEKIRDVIDTIGKKAVLILGRFTEERIAVLDALREELRKRDRLPILFDFEKAASQDILGTVETLARMARFVIADITEAASVPAELQAIVPHLRTVPVQPLLRVGAPEYALFTPLKAYPWVLEMFEYRDVAEVRASLDKIISPAEAKARKLREAKQDGGSVA
jgi:uncharacterized protein YjbI with pentapeptide repeats